MNWKHLPVAIIFFLFAFWQYNDPDPVIWIAAYGILAILILLFAIRHVFAPFGEYYSRVFLIATIIYTLGMLCYLPKLWIWINEGFPSITGEMKAESPLIEWMREFFGLMICAITSIQYSRWSKRKK